MAQGTFSYSRAVALLELLVSVLELGLPVLLPKQLQGHAHYQPEMMTTTTTPVQQVREHGLEPRKRGQQRVQQQPARAATRSPLVQIPRQK